MRHRRFRVSLLAVILLWLSPGMSWCRTALAASSTPSVATLVPLVLIAEVDRSEDEIPEGFVEVCEREGYVPDKSLFQLSPGLFSDLGEGASRIAEFVNACSSKAPEGRVDIIACGVSGLVTRLALEAGMIPGRTVGNLVMVAAPNRGTFVADLLKSIVEIAKHESLFEREGRAGRLLPSGEDLLSLFVPSKGDDGLDYSRLTDPQDMEWSDETSWVAERVRQVYEPLYARYVEARYSTMPYVPAESPKETFAGWISRTMPQFWETAMKKSTLPPDGSPFYPSGGPSVAADAPPEGKDLSVAYYEFLSMEVAKNQYVMRLAAKGSIVESVLKEPYLPSGWKDALLHYGTRVLQYYARKALITVKAELQQVVVNQVVRRAGFVEDSASPLLRRLIKEDLVVNLGTSISRRFERLPANTYLIALNTASLEASPKRRTRYISVAAKLASPWSLIWPQLGPNDFFLETDSTVAPSGPRDCHKVFGGVFSPSGQGLLESKEVQAWLLPLLREDLQVSARPLASEPGTTLKVSSWEPVYLEAAGGFGAVQVALSDPPSGWQFEVWTEGYPGDDSGGPPECASLRFLATGGPHTLDASLGRVGLRLFRTGTTGPFERGKVGSAYAVEVRAEAVGGPAPAGSLPITGGKPDDGPPGDALLPVAGADPAMPAYPLVRVVNRSKQTTHEQAKETYHAFWTVDFGDGDTQRIDGSPELYLSHKFKREGSYRVEAQSFDNHGEPLLTKSWKVSVSGDKDAQREFSCRSVPRAEADAVLSGPVMWVTGKPAVYSVGLKVDAGPDAEVVSVDYDPGPKFCVLWERSGDFQVTCAATVRLRYFIEGETFVVLNTYLKECTVSVLTTGVTR